MGVCPVPAKKNLSLSVVAKHHRSWWLLLKVENVQGGKHKKKTRYHLTNDVMVGLFEMDAVIWLQWPSEEIEENYFQNFSRKFPKGKYCVILF